jgi:hypothetical protein
MTAAAQFDSHSRTAACNGKLFTGPGEIAGTIDWYLNNRVSREPLVERTYWYYCLSLSKRVSAG